MEIKQDHEEQYDTIIKLVFVGDSAVGKTSIIQTFSDDLFDINSTPTIGVDFVQKIHELSNGQKIKYTIWDTAGQEKFRTITTSYYRGVQGIILVYDVERRHSFENLESWLKEIKNSTSGDVEIMLIGNKTDGKRQITEEEGLNFAKKNNLLFIETSAKLGEGISQAFEELALKIIQNPDIQKTETKNLVLTNEKDQETKENGGACGGWCLI
ncbi:ras and ef-hand domain-containing protein [Anaeramoeba ignava]|uniref:Ras and ef-hand domain-containing protein n=1 Tax=Anaeramoeba ignava TaxID=1746090 RepID=A0A9Q0RFZ4_ANAIG|nr:ras and ef-hand domain-containing protein [Anaeramoeba ignava]